MKNKKLFLFLALVILPFIQSCDSTDPNDGSAEYVLLNIGDLRQYTSVIDSISYYQSWEVVSKACREDGLEVYATKWYMNEAPSTDYYITYHFIRKGYFYSTELNKSDSLSIDNPFDEQRLAKVSPFPGEKWTRNEESPNIFTAKFIGEKSTPAGDFSDVYAFNVDEPRMHIYCARNFGHIGAGLYNGEQILVNYIKVNGIERGKYVTSSGVLLKKADKKELDRIRKNILGQL
ncbi:MAG TPA: hypothetical protein VHO28_06465 [Ignavibacteriales bacterium]|nr:hypothetical protein [Ignavibacteriales bacterium]